MKYLYGASIQGIQKFIFGTGKLKEIVGASEIVDSICHEQYKKYVDKGKIETIVRAAGNIRLLADDNKDLDNIVKDFPKDIVTMASGIQMSQAMIEIEGDTVTGDHFYELDKRLKTQRNKVQRPFEITALGIDRSRRTGNSGVKRDSSVVIDNASEQKQQEVKSGSSRLVKKILGKDDTFVEINGNTIKFPYYMDDIVNDIESNWLAVIHADGNNLGKIIQTLFEGDNIVERYKSFSSALKDVTEQSLQKAFSETILEPIINGTKKINNGMFPFRPIIIGGDDITVICRADLALDFVSEYLRNFEKYTQENESIHHKLTACAGIAFVKPKYPFHYAIDLAEELCRHAKKKSKELDEVPSSIAFHKVLSSFIGDYKDITERELTAGSVGFDYGPYVISGAAGNFSSIDDLLQKINILKLNKSTLADLRTWLGELHKSHDNAALLIDRINQLLNESGKQDVIDDLNLTIPIESNNKTIFYDVMTILSMMEVENES